MYKQYQESILSAVIPDILYRESILNEALLANQQSRDVEHTQPSLGRKTNSAYLVEPQSKTRATLRLFSTSYKTPLGEDVVNTVQPSVNISTI